MKKRPPPIMLHLSTVRELLMYYSRQGQWGMLPGLLIWSLLPLSTILILLGVLVLIQRLIAGVFGA